MSESETVATMEGTTKPPYHVNPLISPVENIRLMFEHYFPQMKFKNSQDMFDNIHMWISRQDLDPTKMVSPPNDQYIYLGGRNDPESKLYLYIKSVSHDGFHGFRKIVLKNVIPYHSLNYLNEIKNRLPIVVKFNQPHEDVLAMSNYSLNSFLERSNNPFRFIENSDVEMKRKFARHLGLPEWVSEEWWVSGGRADYGARTVDGKKYMLIAVSLNYTDSYSPNALHLANKRKAASVFYAPYDSSHYAVTFMCYAIGNDFDEWHAQNASS